MSQANVEMVRRGIEDVEAFWAMLDEHVVWDLRAYPVLDLDPFYVGRDAVIGASRHYWGTWEDYRLDAEEIIEAGSSVVVAVHERMRGKGSGAPIDRHWAQVWTFHRGRIIRWELFEERAEALEALGLSESAMSQENVELFRRASGALERGGFDDALIEELIDPDVSSSLCERRYRGSTEDTTGFVSSSPIRPRASTSFGSTAPTSATSGIVCLRSAHSTSERGRAASRPTFPRRGSRPTATAASSTGRISVTG